MANTAAAPLPQDDTVRSVLKHIRERQAQPGGTGNPEGHTQMETYHVWEVLNALKQMSASPSDS